MQIVKCKDHVVEHNKYCQLTQSMFLLLQSIFVLQVVKMSNIWNPCKAMGCFMGLSNTMCFRLEINTFEAIRTVLLVYVTLRGQWASGFKSYKTRLWALDSKVMFIWEDGFMLKAKSEHVWSGWGWQTLQGMLAPKDITTALGVYEALAGQWASWASS